MTQSAGQWEIPQATQPRRATDEFSPPGDYFAPFFDVVFYRPSALQGTIESLEEQVRVVPPEARAGLLGQIQSLQAQQTAQQAATQTLGGRQEIGASSLALRSVGGGLQSYDPAGPNSPLGQLVNYRANLEVTMLSAAALQATLTITPPYEDALRIIDSQAIKFGSLMEIQWGYLSSDGSQRPAISDKGLFRITQPSIKFGQQVTITIGGFDILSSSLSTQDVRCIWSREQYECDLSILRRLISRKAPSGVTLDDSRVGDNSPLRRRKASDVVQGDDDWTFFRRLCRQNDVAFAPSGTTIILTDENRIDIAKPKYRLTWFMQPTGKLDIPMISFETNPIMGYFASEGSRGQRTYCRNSETGEIEVLDRDPGNTGVPQSGAPVSDATNRGHDTTTTRVGTGGSVAAFAELDEECASGRVFTQPCRRPNRTEETDRENREVRRFHNTRATAVVPGVPGLIPQQIAEVVNVGDVFSGCYRVMKTIHTIGSGYTVKVDLIRASSAGVRDGTAATQDRANCQPLDPEQPTGGNVNPTEGGDPPLRVSEGANAGCIQSSGTSASQGAAGVAGAAGAGGT